MWTWLTSRPALIIGLIASIIGIGQYLQGLTRKVILFPRRHVERQVGHAVMSAFGIPATGKGAEPPEGRDWSIYKA